MTTTFEGGLPKPRAGGGRTLAVGLLLALLAIGAGAWLLLREGGGGGDRDAADGGSGGRGPAAVLATEATTADVPVHLDGVGTVQAFNTAAVRAEVAGKLVAVTFREGQEVRRGDVLARIDPVAYRAAYDQAVARKAMNQALLDNARRDLARYVNLARADATTAQTADTQRATVAQYEAQVAENQAAIDGAKADLDRTSVRAPIDGRTGIRQVDAGNLVTSTDATGVVVVSQLRPVSVVFTLPETTVGEVNRAAAAGPVTLEALRDDAVLDRGTLAVVDNQVDQATGTIRIKGTFANRHSQLWPGQFVNVRLRLKTLRDAVVVPAAAVQQGPSSAYVYRVGTDNKARLATVTIVQQDEDRAVIGVGLAPGDRVMTTGFARVQDGDPVTVQRARGAVDAGR